jgi:hypothetical protein
MASFEELDGLLAEALQCLNDAAGLVRELTQLETKPSLMHLGNAIYEAWELRERVHGIRPDLKPPFVVEYEEDRVRYNKLSEISKEAHQPAGPGRTAPSPVRPQSPRSAGFTASASVPIFADPRGQKAPGQL